MCMPRPPVLLFGILFTLATAASAIAEDEPVVEKRYDVKSLAESEEAGKALVDCIENPLNSHVSPFFDEDLKVSWQRGELVVSTSASLHENVGKLLEILCKLPESDAKEAAEAPKTVRYLVRDVRPRAADPDAEYMVAVYPVGDLLRGPATVLDAAEQLAEFLSVIAPSTWGGVGGDAEICVFESHGALVLSHTREIHKQVEVLLTALRKVPIATNADADRPLKVTAIAVGSYKLDDQEFTTVMYPVADFEFKDKVNFDPILQLNLFVHMIEPITEAIAPSSWEAVGGNGSIQDFEPRPAIVVANTKEVQSQIASLLAALRKIPRYSAAAKDLKPQPPSTVATFKEGKEELLIVVYDVGTRITDRDGGADFEPLVDQLTRIDADKWTVNNDSGTSRIAGCLDRGALIVVAEKELQGRVAKAIEEYRLEEK